ncbi:MAG: Proteasome subunit beta type-4 [Icmadophila ericetorum]|nr:Proteasome subunit beta type-4 [Icmadophila ericetorum]
MFVPRLASNELPEMEPSACASLVIAMKEDPANPYPLPVDNLDIERLKETITDERDLYHVAFNDGLSFFNSERLAPIASKYDTRFAYYLLWLLQQPDLPPKYRAKCHLVLGAGNFNTHYHAQMAVRLIAKLQPQRKLLVRSKKDSEEIKGLAKWAAITLKNTEVRWGKRKQTAESVARSEELVRDEWKTRWMATDTVMWFRREIALQQARNVKNEKMRRKREGKESEKEEKSEIKESARKETKGGSKRLRLKRITGKDFTLIAASKAAMRGATILKATDDKTKELNQYSLMAIVGEAGDTSRKLDLVFRAVHFAEYIQANIQLYSMRNDADLGPSAVANFVRGELAKSLRSRKPYTVNLLLGGMDPITKKPSLYWLDYLAALAPLPYAAHGYAQYAATFSRTQPDMRHLLTRRS